MKTKTIYEFTKHISIEVRGVEMKIIYNGVATEWMPRFQATHILYTVYSMCSLSSKDQSVAAAIFSHLLQSNTTEVFPEQLEKFEEEIND